MFSDFTIIIIISVSAVCVLLILVCGILCAVKCSQPKARPPPLVRRIDNDQKHMDTKDHGNNDTDHYRSLLRYKPQNEHPNQWNATTRHSHYPDNGHAIDYATDRNCTTLPWSRNMSAGSYEYKPEMLEVNAQSGNSGEVPKYFVLDTNFINRETVNKLETDSIE